jgi:antitoxin HicB
MRYPIKLTKFESVFLVSSRDLQGLNTEGDTVEEALANAAEGMALVLQYCIDERMPLPVASEKKRGEYWVELTPLQSAKAGLYEAMRAGKVRKSELIRKLRTQAPQVDRLLDLTHKSKLEHVVAALDALGYRVHLSVEAKRAA